MLRLIEELERNGREQNGKGETPIAEWKWEWDQWEGEKDTWGAQAVHKLNEAQQEEEGESGNETAKEQTNRQQTNKKRWKRGFKG